MAQPQFQMPGMQMGPPLTVEQARGETSTLVQLISLAALRDVIAAFNQPENMERMRKAKEEGEIISGLQ